MKKLISLAGPMAALIALKCPVCFLALAGFSAGIGSLFLVIQGLYWIVVIGLGALFVGFLLRSWKANNVSVLVLGLGLLGFSSLIYQVATEADGFLSILPAASLIAASIGTFLRRSKTKLACCNSNEKMSLNLNPRESSTLETNGGIDMAKRKVEVFTSGCPVCKPVVDLVKKTACPSCDVVIYDLNTGCATNECRDKAKYYGITRVPAVVVDGKLLDCCKTGTVSEKKLKAAGVGSQ